MAADVGRLRWRCRRGMKELDLLLTRYLDERYGAAAADEQEAFQQLLESQDPAIYAYCVGSERPPAQFAALIKQITAHSPAGRR